MADLLRTAITGLNAFRTALNTTGHNVANVDTPFYSRQRVELGTQVPQKKGFGYMGNGVSIQNVARAVDQFVLKQMRTQTSSVSRYEKLDGLTSQLGALLGDGEVGLTPDLESFFGALQDMANSPSSIPARQVFLDEGRTLTTRIQDINQSLNSLRDSINTGIRHGVDSINGLTQSLAKINNDIAQATASSTHPANDLLDTRDRILTDLSKMIGISTVPQDDGSVSIFMSSGHPLVLGNKSYALETTQSAFDPQKITVRLQGQAKGSDLEAQITGGELGGYFEFRNTIINPAQDALGLMAIGIADTFNAQHQKGMDLNGNLGEALFNVGSPKVWAHTNNNPATAAVFSAKVTDATKLVRSDYEIKYDGTNYSATRLSDDKVIATGNLAALNSALGNEGLQLNLDSGSLTKGDRFLLEPTRYGAPTFALNISDPRHVAAAAPIKTALQAENIGAAQISAGSVLDASNPALQNNVRIQFTSANTFDVLDLDAGATLASGVPYTSGSDIDYNGWRVSITGNPQGGVGGLPIAARPHANNSGDATIAAPTVDNIYDKNLLNKVEIRFTSATQYDVFDTTQGVTLASGVSYTSGGNITHNGWTVQISDGAGTPKAGDTFQIQNDGDAFHITNNQGGLGDNRNALALVKLETKQQLMGGNDYRGVFAQMIAEVGAQGRRVDNTLQSQTALLEQSTAMRESVSGVNLDEEAANLIRFQQAFEASAQMIQAANQTFNALLAAVKG